MGLTEPSHANACPDSLLRQAQLLESDAQSLRERAARARRAGLHIVAAELEARVSEILHQVAELKIRRLEIKQHADIRLATIDGVRVDS